MAADNQTLASEMAVLRQRADSTDAAIGKLTQAVEHLSASITKANSKDQDANADVRRELAELKAGANSRPDLMKIIGGVLGAYTVVIGIIAGSLSMYLAPDRQNIARVEREVAGLEVLKYRVQLLEGKKP